MIDQLLKLEFSTIDLPGASSELAQSQNRLESLLNPDSDASQAKVDYDSECETLNQIHKDIRESEKAIAVLDDRHTRADGERSKAIARINQGLSEEEHTLAEKKLPISSDIGAENLADAERTPELYDQNIDASVPEPIIAGTVIPTELNDVELSLYQRLLNEPRGRLEQEFLPEWTIHHAIQAWCDR